MQKITDLIEYLEHVSGEFSILLIKQHLCTVYRIKWIITETGIQIISDEKAKKEKRLALIAELLAVNRQSFLKSTTFEEVHVKKKK